MTGGLTPLLSRDPFSMCPGSPFSPLHAPRASSLQVRRSATDLTVDLRANTSARQQQCDSSQDLTGWFSGRCSNVRASEVGCHSKSGAPSPQVGQVRSWVGCEQCR